MAISSARLEANRLNAQKSTGPRTAAGKRRASMNGVSHGIFCNDIVLPRESATLFKAFRDAFLFQLQPRNIVELMLVDRIVTANWKLKRLNQIEAAITDDYALRISNDAADLLADMEPEQRASCGFASVSDSSRIAAADAQARAFSDEESSTMERLDRHGHRLEMSIHRSLRELQNMRKRTQAREPRQAAEALYPPVVTEEFDEALDELKSESEPTAEAVAKEAVPKEAVTEEAPTEKAPAEKAPTDPPATAHSTPNVAAADVKRSTTAETAPPTQPRTGGGEEIRSTPAGADASRGDGSVGPAFNRT